MATYIGDSVVICYGLERQAETRVAIGARFAERPTHTLKVFSFEIILTKVGYPYRC